ncbi:MAG: hypothetical protein Q8P95_01805 [bacterium]|nr:hypothetical protein [bacterium]
MLKKKSTKRSGKGFGLIESLVSITVFTLIATAATSVLVTIHKTSLQSDQSGRAYRILEESYEAVRFIRDDNFLYLRDGNHGLRFENNTWSFTEEEQDTINGIFTRQIAINSASRDGSGNVTDDGTLDPRTKEINITVSWLSDSGKDQQVTSRHYLSDWSVFELGSDSTQEWEQGSHDQTAIDLNGPDNDDGQPMSEDDNENEIGENDGNDDLVSGGTLVLSSNSGSWNDSVQETGLSFSYRGKPGYLAVRNSRAYLVGNQSSIWPDSNFLIADVSHPEKVSVLGSTYLLGHPTDIAISGNSAYVSTSNPFAELQVVDISNDRRPYLVGIFSILFGNHTGLSVAIEEGRLYFGATKNNREEFYIFDTADRKLLKPLGKINLEGSVEDIAVDNQRAYLAMNGGSSFIILDVSKPENIQILSQTSIHSGHFSQAISYHDHFVYLGSQQFYQEPELIIYDVREPRSPRLVGSLDTNEQVTSISIFDQYAFLSNWDKEQAVQIINIQNPAKPWLVHSLDLKGNARSIVANQDAIYVTTNHFRNGLYIIRHPGKTYVLSGTYTSPPLDSGSDSTKWNTLNWEGVIPGNSTVGFQIRTANTQTNLNRSVWIGPDGASGTNFTDFSSFLVVDPKATGTRWIQYKVTLTGNGKNTPEVRKVRLQFRP